MLVVFEVFQDKKHPLGVDDTAHLSYVQKKLRDFSKNVGDFLKSLGELLKKVGVFRSNSGRVYVTPLDALAKEFAQSRLDSRHRH